MEQKAEIIQNSNTNTNNLEETPHLQENEYAEASSIEKKLRIQLLMEGKTICNIKQLQEDNINPTIKKIQLYTPLVEYEWEISQKIQEIPHTELYFLTMTEPPIQIQIGEITEDNIEKCVNIPKIKQDQEEKEEPKLVSSTYKRKQAIPLFAKLQDNQSELFFMTILDTFTQIIYAIKKLMIENHIIMFDINQESIFYDIQNNVPFLIDHRISIQKQDLINPEKRRDLIPHYELPYQTICVEIWLLSNIIEFEESAEFNQPKLFEWIDQYKQHTIPNTKLDSYIEQYKQSLANIQSWSQLEEELIKTSISWDLYSIAIIYFKIGSQLIDLRTKYEFLETWFQVLESIIYSLPQNRPNITKIIEDMETNFKTVDQELYYTFLLEVLD